MSIFLASCLPLPLSGNSPGSPSMDSAGVWDSWVGKQPWQAAQNSSMGRAFWRGLSVALWFLMVWVRRSQPLHTAAPQTRNKGLKPCFFKGCHQNYFISSFSSPSSSLPAWKECPVEQLGLPPCFLRTTVLSASGVQAALKNNWSCIAMISHLLQDPKGYRPLSSF